MEARGKLTPVRFHFGLIKSTVLGRQRYSNRRESQTRVNPFRVFVRARKVNVRISGISFPLDTRRRPRLYVLCSGVFYVQENIGEIMANS